MEGLDTPVGRTQTPHMEQPTMVFEHRFEVDAPIDVVRDFHGSTAALEVLTPPGAMVKVHDGGELQEGLVVRFTMWLGPIPVEWTARHENVGPDGFVDVMVSGPMAYWRHTHSFIATASGTTQVVDRIEYAHPEGMGGIKTRVLFGKPALGVLFGHRRRATQRVCEALVRESVLTQAA